MESELHEALLELRRAFENAARRHGEVFVDCLLAPGCPAMIVEDWRAFVSRQPDVPQGVSQLWLVGSDASELIRFWGDCTGIEEFRRLAESAYLLVARSNPALPTPGGYEDWIVHVLFNRAGALPTALLRHSPRLWGWGRRPTVEDYEAAEDRRQTTDDGRTIPVHPFQRTLAHGLFTSSIATDRPLPASARWLCGDALGR